MLFCPSSGQWKKTVSLRVKSGQASGSEQLGVDHESQEWIRGLELKSFQGLSFFADTPAAVCLALTAALVTQCRMVVYFEDAGWSGVTPYLRFLALPHQQPPKVTASSMFWTNFATLFPLRAGTQIGHPISQKSGSLGCRIGIFHPFHPYFFPVMIASCRFS